MVLVIFLVNEIMMVILGMMAMYGNEGGGNTINDISGYDNSCDYNGNYIL